MLTRAAFLPLTLGALDRPDPARARTDSDARAVADAVRHVEQDARMVWLRLLGGADPSAGTDLALGLRRLSLVVGGFVGLDRWFGSAHRDRVAGYQLWLEEALTEGDGAGFARAFAGYDEALARALTCAGPAPAGADPAERVGRAGTGPIREGADPAEFAAGVPGRAHPPDRRSGTMAGWARQARAVTSRVTMRATGRRETRLTTSRRATSSSRWSRRSRSAG